MRRLQPVADVWQRSSDDYAHGVIHVRTLHFVFDVDRVMPRIRIGHWTSRMNAKAAKFAKVSVQDFTGCERRRSNGRFAALAALAFFSVRQTSRFFTSSALSSMNLRRGSTWSPISVVNIRSASV